MSWKFKLGMLLLSIILTLALFGPIISGYTYYDIDLSDQNLLPSSEHWMGTDDLGRDVFTRVWYGARISLGVGVAAAVIDLFIGVLWGGVAAFAGGKVDSLLMRLADILYALPYLLVVILLLVIMGPGLLSILVAMTAIGWITMARIVRGQVMQLKTQEYILSAKALGAGFWRILFRHLLPNAFGPIVVTLTLTIPTAIFTEAFLSFLGLGVQAPIASWGTMANEGLPALAYYPWRLFFPATLISVTMFAFHMIGEGLRDSLQREVEFYVPAS
jgi:oligopeptide transport system permease protein